MDITSITGNACNPNSRAFFATDSLGNIQYVAGGNPGFVSTGFSTQLVYSPSSKQALHDIASSCCLSNNVTWAVGDKKTLLYNDGSNPSNWVQVTGAGAFGFVPPNSDFLGVYADACNTWVVGFNGLILHRDAALAANPADPNQGWTLVNAPTGGVINTLIKVDRIPSAYSGCAQDQMIFVGKSAEIYLSGPAGSPLVAQPLPGVPSNTELRDIQVFNDGTVMVVGTGGVVVRGTPGPGCTYSWVRINVGTTQDLNAISATSPSNIEIVGNNGTVTSFNGTQWTVVNGGTNSSLLAILNYFGFYIHTCSCTLTIPNPCEPISRTPTPTSTLTPNTPTSTPTQVLNSPTFSQTSSPGSPTDTFTPTPTSTPTPSFTDSPTLTLTSPAAPITLSQTFTPTPMSIGHGCCGGGNGGPGGVPTLVAGPPVGGLGGGNGGAGFVFGDVHGASYPGGLTGEQISQLVDLTGGPHEDYSAICCTRCNGVLSLWAVGKGGVVRHYFQGQWTLVNIGTSQDLKTVACYSTGVVWIGGNNGTVFRGDSVAGSCTNFNFVQQPIPNPNMEVLDIKMSFNQDAVFIVGADHNLPTPSGLAYYANLDLAGQVIAWTPITLPAGTGKVNKIIQASATSFWVVADGGSILYTPDILNVNLAQAPGLLFLTTVQVGGASVPLSSINFTDVASLSVNPDEIFVTGGQGVILHLVGGTWQQVAIGLTTQDFKGLAVVGPNQVYFVGNNGTVVEYNGSAYYRVNIGTGGHIVGICDNMVCVSICHSPCHAFIMPLPAPFWTVQGFIMSQPTVACRNITTQIPVDAVLLGQTDVNYVGTAIVSSSDPNDVFVPSNVVAFSAADGGLQHISITFAQTGNHRITIADVTTNVPNYIDVVVGACQGGQQLTLSYTPTQTLPTSTSTFTTSPTTSPSTTPTASHTPSSCCAGFVSLFNPGIPYNIYGDGHGLTVDKSGNIYVTDITNNLVRKFFPDGTPSTTWGGTGTGNGQFQSPLGIQADSFGNIYVADSDNFRVQKFNQSGTYLDQWGSYGVNPGEHTGIGDIATDSSGNVYSLDITIGSTQIQKFSPKGALITSWNLPGGPPAYSITINSYDEVFVSSSSPVMKFDSNGNLLSTTGGFVGSERGYLASDPGGDIWVSQGGVPSSGTLIKRFTRNGTLVCEFGNFGGALGEFSTPNSFDFNSTGAFFIIDGHLDVHSTNILKFLACNLNPAPTASPTFTATFTATPMPSSCSGCAGFVSQFNSGVSPSIALNGRGLTVDRTGNIYVTDYNLAIVRKFLPDGTPSTWSDPGGPGTGNGQFQGPLGIHADTYGNIYVADAGNKRIQKFTQAGVYEGQWGSSAEFHDPADIATDSFGNVYVVDDTEGSVQVQKFSPTGVPMGNWNLPESALAWSISINSYDEVFISFAGGIAKYNLSGDLQFTFNLGGSFGNLTSDLGGDLWVTDSDNSAINGSVIKRFTRGGTLVCQFGTFGSGPGQFHEAEAIDFDNSGNFYVIDNPVFPVNVLKFQACNLNPTPIATPAASSAPISSARVGSKPDNLKITSGLSVAKPLIAFPNPARDVLRTGFYLEEVSSVRMILMDLSGATLRVSSLGTRAQGEGVVEFDLGGLSSGLYFVVLQVNAGMGYTTKMVKKVAIVR
jgi:streptogramin lyase